MNWIDDTWCGTNKDAFCPAVDQETGLLYFLDRHHVSPSGSVKQAKHMRKEYRAYLKRNNMTL